MNRLAVIGGGVIGLSVAFEMAGRGWEVSLLDVGPIGRSASWAGAGILDNANSVTAIESLRQLEARSHELHPVWSRQLLTETGIDNGFRQCGAIYLARTPGDRAALAGQLQLWRESKIECSLLSPRELSIRAPGISSQLVGSATPPQAVYLPDEYQVRNPDHLAALIVACKKRGVRLIENAVEVGFELKGNRIQNITSKKTANLELAVDQVCIACGAWSGQVSEQLGVPLPMVPVRGQLVLFKLAERQFEPITHEGGRYIVPRDDGHVLVGATVEEVGFDPSTTESALAELRQFATSIYPALNEQTAVRGWAGLRPATYDGFPYIGRLPGLDNGFVAAGHFRAGLHLSTGTAEYVADLIEHKTSGFEFSRFDPSRATRPASQQRVRPE